MPKENSSCESALRPLEDDGSVIKALPADQASPAKDAVLTGAALLRDPAQTQSLSFPLAVRQRLKLAGLLPPRALPQTIQVEQHLELLRELKVPINKYSFLMSTLERNERLFFRLVQENITETLPIIYTPVVGEACLNFGKLCVQPRGMYVSYEDRGNIRNVLANWPRDDVRVIVVTDGERILGLGDLGVYGMGIPVGKLLLYTAIGGVDPQHCLPIALDVGCNRDSIKKDKYYFGLDRERVTGAEYDAFVDEFMQAVVDRFGPNTLIQFEDFANANAARLLAKHRDVYCCFNDDIQGTATVSLAGLMAAMRMEGIPTRLDRHCFLFYGAGSAGIGIADLMVEELVLNYNMTRETARRRCWFLDSKGLVYKGRPNLTPEKQKYAHENPPVLDANVDPLLAAVAALRPTALIGVSTIRGSFTPEIIRKMAKINKVPIICALSNPTSKAECTAEEAYKYSDGRAVFTSGSPFDPVTLPCGTVRVPGQGNNAYCFPGIGFGITLSGAKHCTERMFLEAAKALAEITSEKDLAKGCVFPPLSAVRDISAHIALAVCKQAEKENLTIYPFPDNAEDIERLMYCSEY